jgi:hypothetical protein
MTEEELERKARLWHVESPLTDEKVQAVSTQLMTALPQARLRRRWKQTVIALALFCIPAGSVVIFGSTPKAKIEPLNQRLASKILLASDGTAMEQDSMNHEEIGIQVWKPGSSNPEKAEVPALLFPPNIFPNAYVSRINMVLPDGGWLGEVVDRPNSEPYPSFLKKSEWYISPQCGYLVLSQKEKSIILNPSPGYESSSASQTINDYVIGYSSREIKKYQGNNIIYTSEDTKTIWINGNPKPLKEIKKEDGSVALGYEKESENGQPVWVDVTNMIGKKPRAVKLNRNGGTYWAIYTSPTAKPRPLLEPLFSFSPICLSCDDVDDEGKVVGTLQYPVTEVIAPFVWKEGRSIELQKLLPPNSGWKLTSASQVEGRFVLGRGLYHGKEAMYRLTLPPGVP